MSLPFYKLGQIRPTFNATIYGEPGAGKTSLAATAQEHPDMADVLFCNTEGGLLSIAGLKDIICIDVKSVDRLEEVFRELQKKEKGDLGTVRTVVIDSGSELQAVNLENIVEVAMRKEEEQNASRGRRPKRRESRDEIWQDDYGKSTTQLRRVFRWFRDLDIHVIITALARTKYPNLGREVDLSDVEPKEVRPEFTEKLGKSVTGFCDFVWYLWVDEHGNRRLLTASDGTYAAKTRGRRFAEALGSVVEDPYLPAIYNLLLESEITTENKRKRR